MTTPDDRRAQFDDYIGALFAPEDETLQQIKASTDPNDMPAIEINPHDGYLLQWLMRLAGVRTAVEIGTLAGYSAVWIARALPADGHLISIEKSSKHAQVARQNLSYAGLSDRVEVRQGDALQLLDKLAGHYDMVFIDADKGNYPAYLAWAIDHTRPGGIITAHNAYRNGNVLEPQNESDEMMRQFNQTLAEDDRLDSMIIPIGDGMAVAVRR